LTERDYGDMLYYKSFLFMLTAYAIHSAYLRAGNATHKIQLDNENSNKVISSKWCSLHGQCLDRLENEKSHKTG
jgi:hypothetical protein